MNHSFIKWAGLGCSLAVWLWVTCSPLPQQPKSGTFGDHPIQLYLSEVGRTEATFWGMPLIVTAVFPESLAIRDVELHRGSAQVTLPAAMKSNVLTFTANWTSMPARRDSATGFYYDTLFVSTNGNLLSSNLIKVWVRNLAPVVDSVVVNRKKYTTNDTMLLYTADTARIITATIYCRNAKTENIDVNWFATAYGDSLSKISAGQTQFKTVSYNFIDTLMAVISNNNGATIIRRIAITRGNPARGPVIDSVAISTTTKYRSADTTIAFYAASNDTLTLDFFAQGFNPFDTLRYAYTGGSHALFLQPSGTARGYARYFYTDSVAIPATVQDTVILLDQINATVTDRGGRSVRRHIIYGLVKTSSTISPVIDSLRVGSQTIVLDAANTDSVYTYDAPVFSTLGLRVYPRKQYSADVLTAAWTSSAHNGFATQSGPNYLQVLYACSLSTCDDTVAVANAPVPFDTLAVTVSRLSGTQAVVRVLLRKTPVRTNRAPIIDSVRIINSAYNPDDTLLYATAGGSTINYNRAYVLDTMRLQIVAREPDAGDTVMVSVTARGITGLTSLVKVVGRANVYTCTYYNRSSIYADTLTIRAQDQRGAVTVQKIACATRVNTAPVIDSIQICNDGTCAILSADDSVVVANVGDSLAFTIYSSDSQSDSLVCTWSASETAGLSLITPAILAPPLTFSGAYVCRDSSYVNGIAIRIEDRPRKAYATKRITIMVTP